MMAQDLRLLSSLLIEALLAEPGRPRLFENILKAGEKKRASEKQNCKL